MMKANATFAGRNHALGLVVGLVGGLTLGLAATAEAREVYQGRLLPESGGAARKVSIIVDTFTSSAEAARLQEVLRTKGPLALERAIGKLNVGSLQIGDVQSYPIATATVYESRAPYPAAGPAALAAGLLFRVRPRRSLPRLSVHAGRARPRRSRRR